MSNANITNNTNNMRLYNIERKILEQMQRHKYKRPPYLRELSDSTFMKKQTEKIYVQNTLNELNKNGKELLDMYKKPNTNKNTVDKKYNEYHEKTSEFKKWRKAYYHPNQNPLIGVKEFENLLNSRLKTTPKQVLEARVAFLCQALNNILTSLFQRAENHINNTKRSEYITLIQNIQEKLIKPNINDYDYYNTLYTILIPISSNINKLPINSISDTLKPLTPINTPPTNKKSGGKRSTKKRKTCRR